MAVKKGKKAAQKSFFQKILAWIKNVPKYLANPFINMWREIKKVTWPTRRDLINYTGVVLLFMLFMSVVIGLLDLGATTLVNLLV